MAQKQPATTKLVVNRRARFDYDIHDEFKVGAVLTGPEVRSVRDGRASLRGAYVTVKDGELWLTNSGFMIKQGGAEGVVDSRPRKLLASKKEIAQIIAAKDDGLTVVPLLMTTNTRFIKLTIATAKGKKAYDKREAIKRRDIERETKRMLKNR